MTQKTYTVAHLKKDLSQYPESYPVVLAGEIFEGMGTAPVISAAKLLYSAEASESGTVYTLEERELVEDAEAYESVVIFSDAGLEDPQVYTTVETVEANPSLNVGQLIQELAKHSDELPVILCGDPYMGRWASPLEHVGQGTYAQGPGVTGTLTSSTTNRSPEVVALMSHEHQSAFPLESAHA